MNRIPHLQEVLIIREDLESSTVQAMLFNHVKASRSMLWSRLQSKYAAIESDLRQVCKRPVVATKVHVDCMALQRRGKFVQAGQERNILLRVLLSDLQVMSIRYADGRPARP